MGTRSYDQAIEVAEIAEVKELVMTHHDPDHYCITGFAFLIFSIV